MIFRRRKKISLTKKFFLHVIPPHSMDHATITKKVCVATGCLADVAGVSNVFVGIGIAVRLILAVCLIIVLGKMAIDILRGEGMTDAMRVLTAGAGVRHMVVRDDPGHKPDPYFTPGNPSYEQASFNNAEGFNPGFDQPSFWGPTGGPAPAAAPAAAPAPAPAPAAATEGMYDPDHVIDRSNITNAALLASSQ